MLKTLHAAEYPRPIVWNANVACLFNSKYVRGFLESFLYFDSSLSYYRLSNSLNSILSLQSGCEFTLSSVIINWLLHPLQTVFHLLNSRWCEIIQYSSSSAEKVFFEFLLLLALLFPCNIEISLEEISNLLNSSQVSSF